MTISSWQECYDQNNARKITPDKAKARSLKDTAQERIKFLEKNVISQENANFIFEGYYASATEMIHAVVLLDGYKVDNHVCLGLYIRDVMKKEDLFRKFDDCRYKRNSLVYYGKRMELEVAQESIKKTKELLEMLEKEIEKKLKEK